jgi:hypothetical protein
VRNTLASVSSFTGLSLEGVLAGVEIRLDRRPLETLCASAEANAEARVTFFGPDDGGSATDGGVATCWLLEVELSSTFLSTAAACFCRRVAMMDLNGEVEFLLDVVDLFPDKELREDIDDNGGPSGGVINPSFRGRLAL